MNRLWIPLVALALLLPTGCKTQVSWWSFGSKPQAAKPAPAKPSGPLFVRHVWKADDSLSFLALYYADRPEAAADIQKANPDISFSRALPPGTVIWIPARLLTPQAKETFPLVARPADDSPPRAADKPKAAESAAAAPAQVGEEDLGTASGQPARRVDFNYQSQIKIKKSDKGSAKRRPQ